MFRDYKFNPERYQGTWYEIGKYPVKYEPVPCSHSTAVYRYNSQGNYLNILNTCYDQNLKPIISITGIAKPQNEEGEFLVSFFPESFKPYPVSPVPQPYNVLWTDYNNYAFVGGDPSSYYILSRKPFLNRDDLDFIKEKTDNLGYDIKKVKFNDR